MPTQHTSHQPRRMSRMYVEKPLHGQHHRATSIIPNYQLVSTYPANGHDPQHDATMLPQPAPVCLRSHGWCVLLQCNTTCSIRHRGPHSPQTFLMLDMGLPCRQGVVPLTRCQSLLVHSSNHVRHRGQMHFRCHKSPLQIAFYKPPNTSPMLSWASKRPHRTK